MNSQYLLTVDLVVVGGLVVSVFVKVRGFKPGRGLKI
jgi:hypothetical protein